MEDRREGAAEGRGEEGGEVRGEEGLEAGPWRATRIAMALCSGTSSAEVRAVRGSTTSSGCHGDVAIVSIPIVSIAIVSIAVVSIAAVSTQPR
jgi:hypothetical protein